METVHYQQDQMNEEWDILDDMNRLPMTPPPSDEPPYDRRPSVQSLSQASSVSCFGPSTPVNDPWEHDVLWPQSPMPSQASCGTQQTQTIYTPRYILPSQPKTSLFEGNSKMNEITAKATLAHSGLGYTHDPWYLHHAPAEICLNPGIPLRQNLEPSRNGYVCVRSTPSSASNSQHFSSFSDVHSQPRFSFSDSASSGSHFEADPAMHDPCISPAAILSQNGVMHAAATTADVFVSEQTDDSDAYPFPTPVFPRARYPQRSITTSRARRAQRQHSAVLSGRIEKLKTAEFLCVEPDCDFHTTRAEHLKRHNKMHSGEREFGCALARLSRDPSDPCTIECRHKSRKAPLAPPPNGSGTKKKGIGRRDNQSQHLATHLRVKKGATRNKIVTPDFFSYCIWLSEPREQAANDVARLEASCAKPSCVLAKPDLDFMQNHPVWPGYCKWVEDGRPPVDPIWEAVDPIEDDDESSDTKSVSHDDDQQWGSIEESGVRAKL